MEVNKEAVIVALALLSLHVLKLLNYGKAFEMPLDDAVTVLVSYQPPFSQGKLEMADVNG